MSSSAKLESRDVSIRDTGEEEAPARVRYLDAAGIAALTWPILASGFLDLRKPLERGFVGDRTMDAGIAQEMRRRAEVNKKVGLAAPVESIVDYLFSLRSSQERESIVRSLHQAGIRKGSDLRPKSFGYLHDELNLPERVCKVLLDRRLVQQGAPKEVMWYGSQSYASKPKFKVAQELNDIAGHCNLDAFQMREYAMAVRGKTWIQVAQEHMTPEEQNDALCNPAESEIVYGYRAVLRIISLVLPVRLSLVETSSFMGTLYLVDSSSASKELDVWSSLVWTLQAKPPGMHYLEAMGRLVMSIQLMFRHQPWRKFGIGIIGSADNLDVYMFWAEDQNMVEGKLVPVPRSVTHDMFTLHRTHTGVEELMMLMCAPPTCLGFQHPINLQQTILH